MNICRHTAVFSAALRKIIVFADQVYQSMEVNSMACFLVPGAEALVMTAVTYAVRKREVRLSNGGVEKALSDSDAHMSASHTGKIALSRKLTWLTNLLWGGVVLLAFEHLWHGEIVPWFPFITGASNPADTASMLHEMSTVGVGMAVLVTLIWCIMTGIVHIFEKRQLAGDSRQDQVE